MSGTLNVMEGSATAADKCLILVQEDGRGGTSWVLVAFQLIYTLLYHLPLRL